MEDVRQAARLALDMVARLDPELTAIVFLSLRVSFGAASIAFLLGAPLGGWLAVSRGPARAVFLVLVNAALGLPPVVVGLMAYLVLSRSGPLGALGLLFTPWAMLAVQAVLGLPIVVALTHRVTEGAWDDYGDALTVDGASRPRAVATLLAMSRAGLVTVFLSAFGRLIAEVGAILVVGGNIRGFTRTMTTAIALETSKGDLPLALALGLILIALSVGVSATTFALNGAASRG